MAEKDMNDVANAMVNWQYGELHQVTAFGIGYGKNRLSYDALKDIGVEKLKENRKAAVESQTDYLMGKFFCGAFAVIETVDKIVRAGMGYKAEEIFSHPVENMLWATAGVSFAFLHHKQMQKKRQAKDWDAAVVMVSQNVLNAQFTETVFQLHENNHISNAGPLVHLLSKMKPKS